MELREPPATHAAPEQELGELAYIVAHDLGAAFRQLKGVVDLVLRDIEPVKVERHQLLLEHLDAASSNGQGMISALGAYANLQRRELAPQACAAEALVADALQDLKSTVDASGAQIVVDPLGSITVDRTLLAEAIKRLLDNAIGYAQPGVAPHIRITRQADERDWVAWIADKGVGVPPDQREKVFQLFYRQRPRDPPVRVGAGLTIARRIFRRHGGDLRFIDTPDGACIEMRLPQPATD